MVSFRNLALQCADERIPQSFERSDAWVGKDRPIDAVKLPPVDPTALDALLRNREARLKGKGVLEPYDVPGRYDRFDKAYKIEIGKMRCGIQFPAGFTGRNS
jgi:hypothetical protein